MTTIEEDADKKKFDDDDEKSAHPSFRSRVFGFSSDPMVSLILNRFRQDRMAQFSIVILLVVVFLAGGARLIAPYSYSAIDLSNTLALPSQAHLLGTDYLGRDTLTRIMYGCSSVLEILVYSFLIAGTIGTLLGAFSGFYGGRFDAIFMRAIDVLMSYPAIILALAVVAILGPSLQNAIIAMSIYQIAPYARLIRAQVISAREQLYVENARAVGASNLRILFRHIMPNVIGPLIVQMNFSGATVMLGVAGLSYFGLGAQPPTAEWGLMIFSAQPYLNVDPILIIFPGIALSLVIFALNVIGETVRDAIDPRLETSMRIL